MTGRIETIVRPFAPGDIFDANTLPAVEPGVANLPIITVLFGNPIPLQAAPIGIKNLFGGAKLSEVSRITSTKRVFNPDDHTQFVDVQRIDHLTMQDEQQQTHTFDFNNPA